jgi:hypothetical protein
MQNAGAIKIFIRNLYVFTSLVEKAYMNSLRRYCPDENQCIRLTTSDLYSLTIGLLRQVTH